MKKTLLLLVIVLLGMTHVVAQDVVPFLPIAEDGKKWVNEKVIIRNGDSTRYYYTYELTPGYIVIPELTMGYHGLPSAPGDFLSCHYYEGSKLDVNNDSVICGMKEDFPSIITYMCYNKAYDKVYEDNRNLLTRRIVDMFHGEELYHFYFLECEPFNDLLFKANYLEFQVEPFLTDENFIRIEPIEIEGYDCRRYAYVHENGDTMCYIVEGIGFDSRDMGDLLTPFTRKPSPNADYQEYCGLSHVIKDGKIIYKGMRYNPDNMTGVDEVVADKTCSPFDPNYYNLMGQPMGVEVPATPGICIHNGKKILVGN